MNLCVCVYTYNIYWRTHTQRQTHQNIEIDFGSAGDFGARLPIVIIVFRSAFRVHAEDIVCVRVFMRVCVCVCAGKRIPVRSLVGGNDML